MGNLTKQVNPLKADLTNAMKHQKAIASELQSCQSGFDRKANELREEFRRKEYVLKEVGTLRLIFLSSSSNCKWFLVTWEWLYCQTN